MPTLIKEILPEGSYVANSDRGRIRKPFSRDYMEKLADTGNKMLSAGLRIPAPFDHSKQAVPVEVNQPPSSSYNNAGYWTHFSVQENDEGVPVLVGVLDLPGSKKDPNSPYYKALHTAKEVSLSIRDKYLDGLGRSWDDAILHGALVNHAVVPGQKEFQEIPDGSLILNMSMMDVEDSEQNEKDDIEPGLLEQVRTVLKEAYEIVIPASNKASVFLRDLLVAASQTKASRPVDGQELQPVPVYMSIGDDSMPLTKEQAESLVAAKAVNPATKKPFTMEDLGFKPAPAQSVDMSAFESQLAERDAKLAKASTVIQALVSKLVSDTKNSIQNRINKLIAAGTISKEWAEANLNPKLDFQMSTLDDGSLAPHPLEVTLSALEVIPAKNAPQAQSALFDGVVQPQPYQSAATMTAEEMNKAIDEFCNFTF